MFFIPYLNTNNCQKCSHITAYDISVCEHTLTLNTLKIRYSYVIRTLSILYSYVCKDLWSIGGGWNLKNCMFSFSKSCTHFLKYAYAIPIVWLHSNQKLFNKCCGPETHTCKGAVTLYRMYLAYPTYVLCMASICVTYLCYTLACAEFWICPKKSWHWRIAQRTQKMSNVLLTYIRVKLCQQISSSSCYALVSGTSLVKMLSVKVISFFSF